MENLRNQFQEQFNMRSWKKKKKQKTGNYDNILLWKKHPDVEDFVFLSP